jgi:hypothetical protein
LISIGVHRIRKAEGRKMKGERRKMKRRSEAKRSGLQVAMNRRSLLPSAFILLP